MMQKPLYSACFVRLTTFSLRADNDPYRNMRYVFLPWHGRFIPALTTPLRGVTTTEAGGGRVENNKQAGSLELGQTG